VGERARGCGCGPCTRWPVRWSLSWSRTCGRTNRTETGHRRRRCRPHPAPWGHNSDGRRGAAARYPNAPPTLPSARRCTGGLPDGVATRAGSDGSTSPSTTTSVVEPGSASSIGRQRSLPFRWDGCRTCRHRPKTPHHPTRSKFDNGHCRPDTDWPALSWRQAPNHLGPRPRRRRLQLTCPPRRRALFVALPRRRRARSCRSRTPRNVCWRPVQRTNDQCPIPRVGGPGM
jgi:hypothetical protein